MKMNIEVDIDWMDEEGNVDDTVKDAVVNRIVCETKNAVSKTVVSEAQEKAALVIDKAVMAEVKKFLTNKVSVTNEFGDVTRSNVTVKTLIRDAFSGVMEQKVNQRGEVSRDRFCKTTRLEWMIDSAVAKHVEHETRRLDREIADRVKAALNGRLKEVMADSVKKVLKIHDI